MCSFLNTTKVLNKVNNFGCLVVPTHFWFGLIVQIVFTLTLRAHYDACFKRATHLFEKELKAINSSGHRELKEQMSEKV